MHDLGQRSSIVLHLSSAGAAQMDVQCLLRDFTTEEYVLDYEHCESLQLYRSDGSTTDLQTMLERGETGKAILMLGRNLL